MQLSTKNKTCWALAGTGLWNQWQSYWARWLVFGVVVELFQPAVDDIDQFWLQKLYQAVFGLFYGAVCAVTFTIAQNSLNSPRKKWRTWAIVFASWMTVKLVFVTAMSDAGGCIVK